MSVTIASQAARSGAPMMVHYAASKGAVISPTRSLAYELSGDGITANTIPTTMTLVRRIGAPNDVAAACAFPCSEDAGFITGQLIGVNGGIYM